MRSAAEHTAWLAGLTPWPAEFGLDRMHALLEELGDPQRRYPAVHVVGTNGKTTATRTIAAYLRAEGLRVGTYTSPHVSGWGERLDTDDAGFERAIGRVRPAAERLGATQFETLTAAALAEFAAREVDAAVVEAGLGGRLDATNVLSARVVHLTNVGLEHVDVLGPTREAIAREKLAVAGSGSTVVLGEGEWAPLLPAGTTTAIGDARLAATAFLGHPVRHSVSVHVPGRYEWRSPDELWDGAHNLEGARWLLDRLPSRQWVVVASILSDKDAGSMLRIMSRAGDTFIATRSANPRSRPAAELAGLARAHFAHVEVAEDPVVARLQAVATGRPVLVTGSLYLLAELTARAQDVP